MLKSAAIKPFTWPARKAWQLLQQNCRRQPSVLFCLFFVVVFSLIGVPFKLFDRSTTAVDSCFGEKEKKSRRKIDKINLSEIKERFCSCAYACAFHAAAAQWFIHGAYLNIVGRYKVSVDCGFIPPYISSRRKPSHTLDFRSPPPSVVLTNRLWFERQIKKKKRQKKRHGISFPGLNTTPDYLDWGNNAKNGRYAEDFSA